MKRNRNPTNKPVMKRYATLDSPFGSRSFSVRSPIIPPIILLSFSYRSPIILSSSYHPPIVLLSSSYRSPIVLLSFSYHPPIVLLLGNGKQYGNNTETIRNGAKDERKTNE